MPKARAYLREHATKAYGTKTCQLELDKGLTLNYTDNPNHYARIYIGVRLPGMTMTYALQKSDLTKAGALRLTGFTVDHYLIP